MKGMTTRGVLALVFVSLIAVGCTRGQSEDAGRRYTTATVIQTARGGDKLTEIATLELTGAKATDRPVIALDPATEYQSILGFGGSFTESTAYVLGKLSEEKRREENS